MKRKYLIPILIVFASLIGFISYKNINKSTTLNQNIETSIISNNTNDDLKNSNNKEDIQIKENDISNTEKEEKTNIKNNGINNEENIIQYFQDFDNELTYYNNDDETLGNKIKEKFVTCIDFLFYDKEINEITFKELTNKTKIKILEITMSIDSKIESKFPNYKEKINNTYQNIKSKIIEKYLDTTTNICNEDKDLCNTAKENFQNLKENFNITWNFIKNLIGSSTSKLKDWYEI